MLAHLLLTTEVFLDILFPQTSTKPLVGYINLAFLYIDQQQFTPFFFHLYMITSWEKSIWEISPVTISFEVMFEKSAHVPS